MSLAAPSDHLPLWYLWRSVPRTIRLSPQGDGDAVTTWTPRHVTYSPTFSLAHSPTDHEIKHVRNRRFYIHSLLQQENPCNFGCLVLKYLFSLDLSFFIAAHHLLNMHHYTARSGGNIALIMPSVKNTFITLPANYHNSVALQSICRYLALVHVVFFGVSLNAWRTYLVLQESPGRPLLDSFSRNPHWHQCKPIAVLNARGLSVNKRH